MTDDLKLTVIKPIRRIREDKRIVLERINKEGEAGMLLSVLMLEMYNGFAFPLDHTLNQVGYLLRDGFLKAEEA
jgi:hypothetical protein